MMQTSTLQTNAPDLLSLLFTGMLGDAASLESLDGASFISAFGDQLKDLLIKQGADPGEIAAMDGQALVAQFLMMMQGQGAAADLPAGDTLLGNPAAIDGAAGGEADALAMLRQLLIDATDGTEQDLALSGDTGEAHDNAFLKAIPSDLLDRLTNSSSLEDLAAMGAKPALASGVGRTAPSAPAMPFDMISLLTDPAPAAFDGLADLNRAADEADANADILFDDIGFAQSDAGQTSESVGLTLLGMGHVGSSLSAASAAGQRQPVFDLSMLLQAGGENKLVDEVRWIMDGNAGTAELKLHPPSLGELDVRVSTDAEKTSIQFISQHPIVREVLEAALPRLRDALVQDGVNLGSVTVSDQSPQGRNDSGQEQGQTPRYGQELEAEAISASEEAVPVGSTLSILARRHDYFA